MSKQQSDQRLEPRPTRPALSEDYGLSSKPVDESTVSWSWARTQLAGARNYWIASTRPDGRPHAMPVWGIWLDDTLYFSTGRDSRKARNLAANPALVVHLESGDDVVILEGRVEEITEPPLLARFVDAYETKYGIRPNTSDPRSLVYAVRLRQAFTWQESSFVESAARWRFE